MVGPCPCGVYHCHGGHQCCSAMLAWAPPPAAYDDAGDYSSSSSVDAFYSNYNSSPSVDCTLSLGTPATRRTSDSSDPHQERRRSSFCGWDFLQTSKHSSNSSKKSSLRNGNSSGNGGSAGGGDPLLARRCTNCDTTSTPLWRNGPRGPKSLCNACGIRYKKEERRATAAAATSAAVGGGGGMGLESHVAAAAAGYYNGSWNPYQPEKVQYYLHVHDFTH